MPDFVSSITRQVVTPQIQFHHPAQSPLPLTDLILGSCPKRPDHSLNFLHHQSSFSISCDNVLALNSFWCSSNHQHQSRNLNLNMWISRGIHTGYVQC